MSPERRAEREATRRQLALRPAFQAVEFDDYEALETMVLDPDGPFGPLEPRNNPERVLCLNARESAIKEMTFLHCAAFHGRLAAAQLFLSFGDVVDLEARDWHGMTPLLLAANRNHLPVAQELLRAGADPELTDKFGRSMLLFSQWKTVHTLLVESRTDTVDETTRSMLWSRRTLQELWDQREVLMQQRESWRMRLTETQQRGLLADRKWRNACGRLEINVNACEKANQALDDARQALLEEMGMRDLAVATSKATAGRTKLTIDRYHAAKAKMLRAKARHGSLVRKRAEVRALAASKVGIVDAMKRLAPLSMAAQSFCALALRVVTRNNPVEAAKVVVRGGVEALLSSMRRFPTSVVVQREGCAALANLVQLNAFAREEVSKLGGIRVVFGAMSFLRDSEEAQVSGLRLLCGLTGALEESGAVTAAIEAHEAKTAGVKPGSIEWDELQRAKALLDGSNPSATADRAAAIRVAAFAEPLVTAVLKTFGYGSDGRPTPLHSVRAMRMAAQALYGLTAHSLHTVLAAAVVPLCDCIAPLVRQRTTGGGGDDLPDCAGGGDAVDGDADHDARDELLIADGDLDDQLAGGGAGDRHGGGGGAFRKRKQRRQRERLARERERNPYYPHRCATAEHLDFLRFAIGALLNIAVSSEEMREGVMVSPAANAPERAAHAIRCCTLWTVEVRSRAEMMRRDPLAFVKGGRHEGTEAPAHLMLRLQQLQLHCCLLMATLTEVSDAAVRKTMVREGGFEGALYVLASVRLAAGSEPLGVDMPPETVLTALKAGAARACYLLLLGVRDPATSLPYIADRRDVEPLVAALVEFPEAKPILKWATRCFGTLGMVRKNQTLMVAHGAVPAVVRAAKLQRHDKDVLLYALRCLYALLGSKEGCDSAAGVGAARFLADVAQNEAASGECRSLAMEELKMVEEQRYTLMEEQAAQMEADLRRLGEDMEGLEDVLHER